MLELLRKYPQLLLFGILTAMFSGPGQTFLVSVFIPPMRSEFGMSQTFIASLYSAATLASALLLPWVGRLYDRTRLVWFTLAAGLLLAAGCLVLSRGRGVLMMLLGFFLVRNLGQGTLTMISSATMAKVFGAARGKAIAIANLGYPLGEGAFPFLITTWNLEHGWRSGWVLLAVLVLAFFSPAAFLLTRRDPHVAAEADLAELPAADGPAASVPSWTAGEVLRDPVFHLFLLPMIIPPAYLTALFFHQGTFVVEWKGWSLQLISAGFLAFAAARIFVSFWIGPAVDRLTAKRLFPFSLIPLMIGLIILWAGKEPFWCFIYLAANGATMGFVMTVTGALYAELYGTRHLGSIKGMTASMIVVSTAVAPPLMGYFLDRHASPAWMIGTMILTGLAGTGCSVAGCLKRR